MSVIYNSLVSLHSQAIGPSTTPNSSEPSHPQHPLPQPACASRSWYSAWSLGAVSHFQRNSVFMHCGFGTTGEVQDHREGASCLRCRVLYMVGIVYTHKHNCANAFQNKHPHNAQALVQAQMHSFTSLWAASERVHASRNSSEPSMRNVNLFAHGCSTIQLHQRC